MKKVLWARNLTTEDSLVSAIVSLTEVAFKKKTFFTDYVMQKNSCGGQSWSRLNLILIRYFHNIFILYYLKSK